MENLNSILDILTSELWAAVRYYQITKQLFEANKQFPLLNSSQIFFAGTYDACSNELVLSLSKILVEKDDGVTIFYLLNCALAKRKEFPFAKKDSIVAFVKKQKEELQKFEPIVEDLRILRDKTVAHLDKIHVNRPDQVIINYFPERYWECMETIRSIINELSGYSSESDRVVPLSEMEKDVKREIDYLVGLMIADQNKIP